MNKRAEVLKFAFGGLGGLVCGIDFGIIAVAVPYIRALQLYTDAQIGWIVGGVMLGGIVASACGGHLCDKLGRRATIRLATLCFLVSIPVICLSGASFPVIMAGRVMQGLSCGFLSVAMPLYLAETLPAERRGKGTAGLSAALAFIGALFFAFERGWVAPSVGAGSVTLAVFLLLVFSYSFGPGVCVWLVLSELMPSRIRARGMSIALFSNQFVAWGLASAFLPLANSCGFGVLFFVFAVFGVVYFTTVLFIPETNGLALDQIETLFERKKGND